jgi:hypothetical protein
MYWGGGIGRRVLTLEGSTILRIIDDPVDFVGVQALEHEVDVTKATSQLLGHLSRVNMAQVGPDWPVVLTTQQS